METPNLDEFSGINAALLEACESVARDLQPLRGHIDAGRIGAASELAEMLQKGMSAAIAQAKGR